ncbi:hypothetical protein [Lacinutrix sp. Bg11-31]|uniref:hypothetical protein n=1 Tax=Lacinutrix sp. Bg11-31 TaxID=2057808 RepID=UPI000C305D10|nr:hypothetical protein [Lacinutrix sp. Bg11-31]AUC81586.1 hypothetical protein CW733_05335 [Lacinutrix sp. Bg11-31]
MTIKDLGFCKVRLCENYIINTPKEGVIVSIDESKTLIENILSHFNGKPFVYIIHRINSYSVNPKIYKVASKIENLVGFAIVSNNHMGLKNAEIERQFFNKTFKIYRDLDEAKLWANKFVKEFN